MYKFAFIVCTLLPVGGANVAAAQQMAWHAPATAEVISQYAIRVSPMPSGRGPII